MLKPILICCLAFLGGLSMPRAWAEADAAATATPPPQLMRVATRNIPPFAYQDENGTWQGIAITLWERAAADLGLTSEYTAVSLDDMLAGLTDGRFDAAVAALSVTPEREASFDFTHPFFHTGLGIAVPLNDQGSWLSVLRGLASPRFLGAVGALLLLLSLVGALVWWFERRRNSQFPEQPLPGIGAGLWWSSVTMTTVGYGDKAPATFGGRAVALVWMFASVMLVSTVTASLTTALTLDALSGSISGEDDLARARTGTVGNSTSARRLAAKGIHAHTYADADAALADLAAGRLDAVVYDRAPLRYRIRRDFAEHLQVLGVSFEPQDYAIGLPPGSPQREALNRSLLTHTRGPAWEGLLASYLGEE